VTSTGSPAGRIQGSRRSGTANPYPRKCSRNVVPEYSFLNTPRF
jgi:hypothetical protein